MDKGPSEMEGALPAKDARAAVKVTTASLELCFKPGRLFHQRHDFFAEQLQMSPS